MPEASDTRMTSAAAVLFTDQSRIVVPVKLFKKLQCWQSDPHQSCLQVLSPQDCARLYLQYNGILVSCDRYSEFTHKLLNRILPIQSLTRCKRCFSNIRDCR